MNLPPSEVRAMSLMDFSRLARDFAAEQERAAAPSGALDAEDRALLLAEIAERRANG